MRDWRGRLFWIAALGAVACSKGAGSEAQRSYRYAAEFSYSALAEHDPSSCGRTFQYGLTSGQLAVTEHPGSNEAIVRWRGLGCDVSARVTSPGNLTADDSPCRFPAAERLLVDFGVTAVHLDTLSFDAASGSLEARGRMTQQSGEKLSRWCFELKSADSRQAGARRP